MSNLTSASITRTSARLVSGRFLPASAFALAVTASAAFAVASVADDAEGTEPVEDPALAETIVVTASRAEQELGQVTSSVSVLSGEELRASASLALDDTMRRVPGFSLFRRNSSMVAHPTSQGVSLRGIGPSGVSRTLVLLDGLPLNDPFGGWIYWGRVGRESLDRIEVVRGGGSSLWGNSALGGVIHLVTATPSESGPGLSLSALAGDHGVLSGDAWFGQGFESASLTLSARSFDMDGYPVVRDDQRGPIDVDAFSEQTSVGGRLTFSPGESVQIAIGGDNLSEDRGNGTPLTGNDTDLTSFRFSADVVSGRGDTWTVRGFTHEQEFASRFSAQQVDRSSERPALDQFLVDSEATGLGAQWEGEVGSGLWVAGAEWRSVDGATNEDFFYTTQFNRRRMAGGDQSITGAYVQRRADFGDRLTLEIGARIDRWQTGSGSRLEINKADGSIRRDDMFEDREETAASPRIGFLYALDLGWSLRGSVYGSFRAPTVNELYRPFRVRNDITEANEALEPERLSGIEFGSVRYQGGSRLSLNAFLNRVENPIANVTLASIPSSRFFAPCGFVPGGGSCRQRLNLDRTRIQGLEAELRQRLGEDWRLDVSYLYSNAEVDSAAEFPELEGKRLAQTPEQSASLGLEYSNPEVLQARLGLRFVGEQYEDDLNTRPLSSFAVVDLSAARALSDRWHVFAGLENLLGEEVQVGISGTGLVTIGAPRMVHVGVRHVLNP
ncbi:MAG: TonB-dependent receptor [Holophagales bacterium]|nr:TonB-dependent receptor [Holophagales bacterium]MYD21097.1 TonB-dependent receptor [Holophagales bacterium]MYI33143.1 TonB-dependent receptor [Holophagales bacterium]